jgi:hypothetical protein
VAGVASSGSMIDRNDWKACFSEGDSNDMGPGVELRVWVMCAQGLAWKKSNLSRCERRCEFECGVRSNGKTGEHPLLNACENGVMWLCKSRIIQIRAPFLSPSSPSSPALAMLLI